VGEDLLDDLRLVNKRFLISGSIYFIDSTGEKRKLRGLIDGRD